MSEQTLKEAVQRVLDEKGATWVDISPTMQAQRMGEQNHIAIQSTMNGGDGQLVVDSLSLDTMGQFFKLVSGALFPKNVSKG